MGKDTQAQNQDPRVYLAAERTLLAWVRTGLSLMGFGFVVARFGLFLRELAARMDSAQPYHLGASHWVGTALVLVGVLVTLTAAVRHYRFICRYNRGEILRPRPVSVGVVLSGILTAMGLALVLYLLWL